MVVLKICRAQTPDIFVLQLLDGDVSCWHFRRDIICVDVAPLQLLGGSLDLSDAVLNKHLQPFGRGGDPEQGIAAICIEEDFILLLAVITLKCLAIHVPKTQESSSDLETWG